MDDYGSLVNVESSSRGSVISESGIMVVSSMNNSGNLVTSQQMPTYLNRRTVPIIHNESRSASDKQINRQL